MQGVAQNNLAGYSSDMENDMNSSQIIDALGGTLAVATLCQVTQGAVSQWRVNGIPKPRLMLLQLMYPDVCDGTQQPAQAPE